MNKIVKFVVLPLVGVIVVIAALAAYVAATFDPNEYKPQIVQQVRDKTGRTLKLDGDIKLSLFPSIGAKLGKASLSERASEKEFASVDDLRVALQLMPLLSKQVVVDAVEVKNLRANLVRFKNGKMNIDDLTGGDKGAPEAKNDAAQVRIDIDHVEIENSAITYTDEAEGAQYALTKVDLKTGRIAPGVPSKIAFSGHVQSSKPKCDLDATLKVTLTFDLDKQSYVLDGLDFGDKGSAAGISNLVLSAKGDIDAKPAIKEFLVSRLAISATGKQEGGDVNIKFDVPKLVVTKGKVSGKKIALDATLGAAKGKLVAKVDIPAIDGNAQSFKAGAMTASIDSQQDGATVKAKVTSPLAGSVHAQKIELAKLVATVNVNNPKLPKNPIEVIINGSALVDLAKQNASMTFATKLDDSSISGKAGLAKFTPPFYTFDVNVDQLDADRYLPKSDPKQKKPEEPFDLSALKGLNANGSLQIGSLKVTNIKVSNVRLDVKAANGRLDISPMSANLYQGSLKGALSVQSAAAPVIAIKQNLTGINVGPLLKDAADFDMLEGKGNVSLDVSGQGTTVSALKKALAGNAAIKLVDGAIKGINIGASIRDAKAKLGALKGEKTQAASRVEKTDFSELSASFAIKNGVAHNSDLAGKSPLLRLGGAGNIDIGNERLDYLLKATVVATTTGQGGKELGQLSGLTVPVRLTGSFDAPQYSIDFSGMAESAAKAVVEKKTEEIKSKVEDQVKDKLKGIFGR